MRSLRKLIFLGYLTAVSSFAPFTAHAQLPGLQKGAAPTPTASASDDSASVQAERDVILKKLQALDEELSGWVGNDAEILRSIRTDYTELMSILDGQIIALADAKRRPANTKDADEHFLQVQKELKKDIDPGSFAYLLRLESAFIDSRDDLASLQKAIAQRQSEVESQTQVAGDLSKQLRLEREKQAAAGPLSPSLRSLEVRERVARATAALRKVEAESFTARQTVEQQVADRLQAEIARIQSSVPVSDQVLKKLIEPLERENAKILEEVRTRQRELNQELSHASLEKSDAAERLGRLYCDILSTYLSLMHSRFDAVEFKKQILTKRFELRSGVLTPGDAAQFRQVLGQQSSAADIEIVSQNQALSDIIADYASRQELFSTVENFREINEKIRSTFRSAMMTLAEIGKFSKAIKYLRESGDFSKTAQSPGYAAIASIQSWATTLWNFEVFVVDNSPITLGKLLLALLLFLVGIRVSRFLASRFQKQLGSRLHFDSGAAVAFETISFYALVIIWAVISLQFARIPLTIFTLAGGALAIGIGFGSQTIVKNFFSGMILLLERPIRVGDVVQYDSTIGTVSRIGTRSTIIVTPDQLEVIVPNSYLIENTVTNLTLSSNRMRRKIVVGVAYGSSLRDVSQIILDQVERHKLVLTDPAPDVIFSAFGESALELTLRFWVNIGKGLDPVKVESDLRHLIDSAFREAGIAIPFPKRDIQMSAAEPVKVRVVNEDPPSGAQELNFRTPVSAINT